MALHYKHVLLYIEQLKDVFIQIDEFNIVMSCRRVQVIIYRYCRHIRHIAV